MYAFARWILCTVCYDRATYKNIKRYCVRNTKCLIWKCVYNTERYSTLCFLRLTCWNISCTVLVCFVFDSASCECICACIFVSMYWSSIRIEYCHVVFVSHKLGCYKSLPFQSASKYPDIRFHVRDSFFEWCIYWNIQEAFIQFFIKSYISGWQFDAFLSHSIEPYTSQYAHTLTFVYILHTNEHEPYWRAKQMYWWLRLRGLLLNYMALHEACVLFYSLLPFVVFVRLFLLNCRCISLSHTFGWDLLCECV